MAKQDAAKDNQANAEAQTPDAVPSQSIIPPTIAVTGSDVDGSRWIDYEYFDPRSKHNDRILEGKYQLSELYDMLERINKQYGTTARVDMDAMKCIMFHRLSQSRQVANIRVPLKDLSNWLKSCVQTVWTPNQEELEYESKSYASPINVRTGMVDTGEWQKELPRADKRNGYLNDHVAVADGHGKKFGY